ncbi:hypothetical protein CHS0354_038307 [Potamilus streckersoni]|uniref:Uncharacterized protein n=1 Tax=Potamilus streckersoni TaxID=2493646 RepID=A0AAE0WBW3_9BIVA|nr:hypothetical protein CHS0354_038307 [Potamilus streckersoni]
MNETSSQNKARAVRLDVLVRTQRCRMVLSNPQHPLQTIKGNAIVANLRYAIFPHTLLAVYNSYNSVHGTLSSLFGVLMIVSPTMLYYRADKACLFPPYHDVRGLTKTFLLGD